MKHKYISFIRNALCACMAFSLWFHIKWTSLLLYGEYAYPTEEE